MELSEEITKGLGILGDAKTFSDAALKALVALAFDVLLKRSTEEALMKQPELSKIDALFVKQAYAGIVGFILEAVKHNSDGMVVKSQLEGARVPEARRDVVEKAYVANKEALRRLLLTTGFNYPNIVGVEWRLDYYMKSDKLDKVNVPIYMINLKTEEEGKVKNVQFACTVEELQDLVTKLKQAVKQVDRILQA